MNRVNSITFKIILFCLLLPALLFQSCDRGKPSVKPRKLTPEQLIDINRELIVRESERIGSYAERKGLEMKLTDTGLWYEVEDKGRGGPVVDGSGVKLEYNCSLLDGTQCYDSQQDGYLDIIVGGSDIPAGLDEGLRMLNYGASAIFIIPSYLGYGIVGDGKKIPSRAVLVYKIKVLEQDRK